MDKQLRRILNLVRKTGDRMVVTDANGEDVYVVMGLDQYEDLVSSAITTDCLDDSEENYGYPEEVDLSQNVSDWLDNLEPETPTNIWQAMASSDVASETWNIGTMTENEKIDLAAQFKEYERKKNSEKITPNQPIETVVKQVDQEDIGEEPFYLEPIE